MNAVPKFTEASRRACAVFSPLPNGRMGRIIFQALLDENAPEEKSPARPKVGRNDPCPCGSGKKFKKCCAGT